jgi:hypothetical protein
MTLAAAKGFEVHGRATRKAEFLARMEMLVPWAQFCAVIAPHYPKAGNGRPPVGLERMLRMYLVANWFNLADEACEDALYDIPAFRDFCRIDLGRERVPDATTLLNFRHLLEERLEKRRMEEELKVARQTEYGELFLFTYQEPDQVHPFHLFLGGSRDEAAHNVLVRGPGATIRVEERDRATPVPNRHAASDDAGHSQGNILPIRAHTTLHFRDCRLPVADITKPARAYNQSGRSENRRRKS